jgi:predicted nucleotidyltransferase
MWPIGSRARSDNRPDSDIDLKIEVETGRKFSILSILWDILWDISEKHLSEPEYAVDALLKRHALNGDAP